MNINRFSNEYKAINRQVRSVEVEITIKQSQNIDVADLYVQLDDLKSKQGALFVEQAKLQARKVA